MSIEILPAQLANQIAAGEVVERPASVIKELIENSLDAGATSIKIQIEKGGAKRIKITDNGSGISKSELSLALSRHATSKIKTLNDLESISSLGFRGEALASISSVSRLTLTSKPANQTSAWQASAEGRDMLVDIKPAAHPNGTTIDVQDLFFNTPARRKFLRTDKTEFTHIEEVIKRIALACLDVTFVLIHNDKLIKQYRAANTKAQYNKRVAQICGQKFIDHAIEVECQHNDLHFSGWLAKPSFARNQNDLCYSYVNGRMMRDKLINHAIRQAYSNLLPADTYPSFVLFLTLNHRDVDVNVHPAKHEVRFHQGRYIHDFIFSVCKNSLSDAGAVDNINNVNNTYDDSDVNSDKSQADPFNLNPSVDYQQSNQHLAQHSIKQPNQQAQTDKSYIKPLSYVSDSVNVECATTHRQSQQRAAAYRTDPSHNYSSSRPSGPATNAYYQLMSANTKSENLEHDAESETKSFTKNTTKSTLESLGNSDEKSINFDNKLDISVLHIIKPNHAVILLQQELRLLALSKLESAMLACELEGKWQAGFISQPLLLPVKIVVDKSQRLFLENNQDHIARLGIVFNIITKNAIQVRQFPEFLRNKDVNTSFLYLLNSLFSQHNEQILTGKDWFLCLISLLLQETYSMDFIRNLLNKIKNQSLPEKDKLILLNSTPIDLTSELNSLM